MCLCTCGPAACSDGERWTHVIVEAQACGARELEPVVRVFFSHFFRHMSTLFICIINIYQYFSYIEYHICIFFFVFRWIHVGVSNCRVCIIYSIRQRRQLVADEKTRSNVAVVQNIFQTDVPGKVPPTVICLREGINSVRFENIKKHLKKRVRIKHVPLLVEVMQTKE